MKFFCRGTCVYHRKVVPLHAFYGQTMSALCGDKTMKQ